MKEKIAFTLALFVLGSCLATAEPIPAFKTGSRILFQGDSITDMKRGRGTDPNHILGHSYVFILAAKHRAGFPDLDLDFVNRGVSGNTVLNLRDRWQTDTLDLKPDILSVLIGVNDNGRNVPFDEFEQVYDQLLTDARKANPKLKLVLCEPFGLPSGSKKQSWEAWYDGIQKRQKIVAKLAEKHGATLVKFQAALDAATDRASAEFWIWDGVHPTYAGHQILADAWEQAVRENLR